MKTPKHNYITSEFQFCKFPDFYNVLSFSKFGKQDCNSVLSRRILTKLTRSGTSFIYPKVRGRLKNTRYFEINNIAVRS